MIYRYFAIFTAFFVLTGSSYANTPADSVKQKPKIPAVPKKKKTPVDTLTYKAQQPVVVTGTRTEVMLKDSPVRVEVIGKEQTASTSMVAAGDLLKEQTGMLIAQGTVRTGIQMMGLGPDYTMILVDGQPLSGRVGGVIDLNRVSVGNVERVEVVKGPMSSLYGSEALAGVINIITRKPKDGYSGKLYMQYLQMGPSEAQIENNYANNDITFASFINLKNSQPFTVQQDSSNFPYAGFKDYTMQARCKWYVSNSVSVNANLRTFGSESRGKFLDGAAGFITSNEGSVQTTDRSAMLGADWTHGNAHLSGQVYGTMYNETYNFDVEQGAAGRTDNFIRRTFRSYLQYDVLINDKNRLTLGGEFWYDDASGSRYSENPLYRTTAMYTQWEGNPTEEFSYAFSMRYDNNSAFAVPRSILLDKIGISGVPLLPRLSLTYKPIPQVRVYGTIGEGFKAPDFRQLYVRFSNRLQGAGYDLIGARLLGINLQPEQAHSFDEGIFYQPDSLIIYGIPVQLGFDVRFFHNNLRNLIEFYPYQTLPVVYTYRNLAQVYTQGVEASMQYVVTLTTSEQLSGNFGYQLLEAKDVRVVDAIRNQTAGYQIPSTGEFKHLTAQEYGGLWYRSHHSGVLRIQYDNSEYNLTANFRAQYVGRFGEQQLNGNPDIFSDTTSFGSLLDSNNEYVPGYWNCNATITKRFAVTFFTDTSVLTCSVGVNNMFNTTNPRFIPSLLGRQFFINAGITW